MNGAKMGRKAAIRDELGAVGVRLRAQVWHESLVTETTQHPESRLDRHADLRMWLTIAFVTAVSWIVQSTTVVTDMQRAGLATSGAEPWLREAASHLAMVAAMPIIPLILSSAPMGPLTWRWALPVHIAASILFSVVHVVVMVGLRQISYPLVLGEGYGFGMSDVGNWIYEYRKDALTYLLVALGFVAYRHAAVRRQEGQTAVEDARDRGRLTLKCGGRTVFVDAGDVIRAQAASNYVEVVTAGKTHLARMTLAALEALLAESGSRHVRVHRSHVIGLDFVQEITPTGEGDVQVHLSNGDRVPGSRRYRDVLAVAGA